MTYAIIGFGDIGQALARAFARKGIDVLVASRRSPEALESQAREVGPSIRPVTLQDAVQAEIVFLAVPFAQHPDVARLRPSWQDRVVVDATNAYGVSPEELGGLPSSAAVARGLPGAQLVKGFNHLASKVIGSDPNIQGGRRVVFLSSDDREAARPVEALAEQLGFAPVWLGKLTEGGELVQARGKAWGPLIFKDLVMFGGES